MKSLAIVLLLASASAGAVTTADYLTSDCAFTAWAPGEQGARDVRISVARGLTLRSGDRIYPRIISERSFDYGSQTGVEFTINYNMITDRVPTMSEASAIENSNTSFGAVSYVRNHLISLLPPGTQLLVNLGCTTAMLRRTR